MGKDKNMADSRSHMTNTKAECGAAKASMVGELFELLVFFCFSGVNDHERLPFCWAPAHCWWDLIFCCSDSA